MNTVIRNINGIRGFCIYKNGIPYTYIYTRDAIEMLGLVKIQNGYTKLRIDRFGEYFINIMQDERILNQSSQIGITLSANFKISNGEPGPTSGTSINTGHIIQNNSKYDDILPEFILDRVIFAIANRLHNKTAEQFRFELFNTIIPHFQQTATQDQINKVPILNQTTQFMYDNTNYQCINQTVYNFFKNTLDMHLNILGRLRGQTNLAKLYFDTVNELNNLMIENGIPCIEQNWQNYVLNYRKITSIIDNSKLTINDHKDSVIFNRRIYMMYIDYLVHLIREEEVYISLKFNNEYIEKKFITVDDGEVYDVRHIEPDNPKLKEVVRTLNMDERSECDGLWHNKDYARLFFNS